MIPGTYVLRQMPTWQRELAQAITDPAELLAMLGLDMDYLPAAQAAARLFGLRVPRGFVARIRPRDPRDPLLRQVLPLRDECLAMEGFNQDPVGDLAAMVAPGVLHKYQGRVLLTVTGVCAIHCRYCFRRHFPYHDVNPSINRWRKALDYIAADSSINEIILSGGDPLILSDRRLAAFMERLVEIPHVKHLRLHTRLPIVVPQRVNAELLAWFGATRLTPIMVVHANHSNEIDASVNAALTRLKNLGVVLLNQSVLLRGVNDNVDALCALNKTLFDAGVLPYYLHLLDKVQGAAHFEVDEDTARRLYVELNTRLPGYLVPRLVRELPGMPAKMPISIEE